MALTDPIADVSQNYLTAPTKVITVDKNGNFAPPGGSNSSVSATAGAVPASATYIGANKSGNIVGLSLDGSGYLNVNVQTGGGSNASVGTTGAAIPASATMVGASDGTNLQQLLVESASQRNLRVGVYNGANEMAVDASGRITLVPNSSVNVAQVAGATTSTAASGTQLVGVADGAGNALTSNSTTYTAKKGLDANILGTLGTAFSTAGKVDVKAADGDVFVRQATAANLNMTATQGGTWTVQPGNTANTTAWKVDGSAVTQPVSVASLPALPANQSVNLTQVLSAAMSASNPLINQQQFIAGALAGQTYTASPGAIVSGGAGNSGFSLFNNSTAKNIVIYSITAFDLSSTQTVYLAKVTTEMVMNSTLVQVNDNFNGAASALAGHCTYSSSVFTLPSRTQYKIFNVPTNQDTRDLLTNGQVIVLPANQATGIICYMILAATATMGFNVSWMEI